MIGEVGPEAIVGVADGAALPACIHAVELDLGGHAEVAQVARLELALTQLAVEVVSTALLLMGLATFVIGQAIFSKIWPDRFGAPTMGEATP